MIPIHSQVYITDKILANLTVSNNIILNDSQIKIFYFKHRYDAMINITIYILRIFSSELILSVQEKLTCVLEIVPSISSRGSLRLSNHIVSLDPIHPL